MENNDHSNLQKKVDEIREITERNNEMLLSIKRSMFWRRVFSFVYWVIIIGLAVGVFYFLEPYVSNIFDTYGEIQQQFDALGSSS